MKNKDKKEHILMYTRPLAPPWDEASKNLAYDIALNSDGTFNFHLLTTHEYSFVIKKCTLAEEGALTAEPIFASTTFDAKAKMALVKRLFEKEIGSDVIHFLFTPRALTSLLFRAKLFFSKAKTIQTLATIDDKIIAQPKKLKTVLFADRIIAQSYVTEGKLLSAGIKNVEVIYPGIDLEKFFPQEKNAKLLKELEISKDEIVVLFAGEYTRLGAIDDIISAFEQIFEYHKKEAGKLKLILACRIKCPEDAVKQRKIREYARKEGYLDKLIFLETVSDMPALFSISDINIFPVQEMAGKFDIPLAIVEAMACGKAMIVSDINVLVEFVENGETGIVIPKGAPNQLKESILDLIQNDRERKRLAENAAKYVRKTFNIKTIVKQYKEVYTELLK